MAAATAASVAAARVLGIHAASKDWNRPGARDREASGFGHEEAAKGPLSGIRHVVHADEALPRPLPPPVRDALNGAASRLELGLWTEIGRAWAIIDTRLVIWDYTSDARELVLPADASPVPGACEDFALDRNLGCVGLVVPRVGAFDGTVKYLVVIATESTVYILPATFGESGSSLGPMEVHYDPELVVHGTPERPTKVVGTRDGRIFLTAWDGTLTEIEYSSAREHGHSIAAAMGLAKRARFAKHSTSATWEIVPAWAAPYLGATFPPLDDAVVDHWRCILYTLNRSGVLTAFRVAGTAPPVPLGKPVDVLSDARARYSRDLASPEDLTVASLHVVPPTTGTAKSHLIVVLSNGGRVCIDSRCPWPAPPSSSSSSASASSEGSSASAFRSKPRRGPEVDRHLPPLETSEPASSPRHGVAFAPARVGAAKAGRGTAGHGASTHVLAAVCTGTSFLVASQPKPSGSLAGAGSSAAGSVSFGASAASFAPAASAARAAAAAPVELTVAFASPWGEPPVAANSWSFSSLPQTDGEAVHTLSRDCVPGFASSVMAMAEEPQAHALLTDEDFAPSGALVLPSDRWRPETAFRPARDAAAHVLHAAATHRASALGIPVANGGTGLRINDAALDGFPVCPFPASAHLVHRARRLELDARTAAGPDAAKSPVMTHALGQRILDAQAGLGARPQTLVLLSAAGVHRIAVLRPADVLATALKVRHGGADEPPLAIGRPLYAADADGAAPEGAWRLSAGVAGADGVPPSPGSAELQAVMGGVEAVACACVIHAEAVERAGDAGLRDADASEGFIATSAGKMAMARAIELARGLRDQRAPESSASHSDLDCSAALAGIALHFHRTVRHVWDLPLLGQSHLPDPELLAGKSSKKTSSASFFGSSSSSSSASSAAAAGGFIVSRFAPDELEAVARRLEALARFVRGVYDLGGRRRIDPALALRPLGRDAAKDAIRAEASMAASVELLCLRSAQALRAMSLLAQPDMDGIPSPLALDTVVRTSREHDTIGRLTLAQVIRPAQDDAVGADTAKEAQADAALLLATLVAKKVAGLRDIPGRSRLEAGLVRRLAESCPDFFSQSDDRLNDAKRLLVAGPAGPDASQRRMAAHDAVHSARRALASWDGGRAETLDDLGDVASRIAALGAVDETIALLVDAEKSAARAAGDAVDGAVTAAFAGSASAASAAAAAAGAAPRGSGSREEVAEWLAGLEEIEAMESRRVDWTGVASDAELRLAPSSVRQDLASLWRRNECCRVLLRWLLHVDAAALSAWATRARAAQFGARAAALSLGSVTEAAVRRILELHPTPLLVLSLCRLNDDPAIARLLSPAFAGGSQAAVGAVAERQAAIRSAVWASRHPVVTAYLRLRCSTGEGGASNFNALIEHLERQKEFSQAARECAERALSAELPGVRHRIEDRVGYLEKAEYLASQSASPPSEEVRTFWRTQLSLLREQRHLQRVAEARGKRDLAAHLAAEPTAERMLLHAARDLDAIHCFLSVRSLTSSGGTSDPAAEQAFFAMAHRRCDAARAYVAAMDSSGVLSRWRDAAEGLCGSASVHPDMPKSTDIATSTALLLAPARGFGTDPDHVLDIIVDCIEATALDALATVPSRVLASEAEQDVWGLVSVKFLDAVQARLEHQTTRAAFGRPSAVSFPNRLRCYASILRRHDSSDAAIQRHLIRSLHALVAEWLARRGVGRDAPQQHVDDISEMLDGAVVTLDQAPDEPDAGPAGHGALRSAVAALASEVELLRAEQRGFA